MGRLTLLKVILLPNNCALNGLDAMLGMNYSSCYYLLSRTGLALSYLREKYTHNSEQCPLFLKAYSFVCVQIFLVSLPGPVAETTLYQASWCGTCALVFLMENHNGNIWYNILWLCKCVIGHEQKIKVRGLFLNYFEMNEDELWMECQK